MVQNKFTVTLSIIEESKYILGLTLEKLIIK